MQDSLKKTKFDFIAAMLLGGVYVLCTYWWSSIWFVIIFIIYIIWSRINKKWNSPSPFSTLADWITLCRGLLVSLLLIYLSLNTCSTQWIGIVVSVAALADALDGYVARRLGNSTDWGGWLDMETDAFFMAAVSMIILMQIPELSILSKIVIFFAGGLRYFYVLFREISNKTPQQEPRFLWAKLLAGTAMTLFSVGWFLPSMISQVLFTFAGILIIISFTFSTIQLYRI